MSDSFFTRWYRRVRSTLRFIRAASLFIRTVWKRMGDVDILLLASAISFSILLTMIPILIIIAAFVGIILHGSEVGVPQFAKVLDAIFPAQPFATSIKDSIMQVVADMIAYRTSLGIVGFGALLVTASFVFDILRTALHRIYRIRRRRGVIVSFVHDIGFLFLAFVLLLTANLSIWLVGFLGHQLAQYQALQTLFIPEFFQTIPTGLVIILTAVLFYIVYGHLTDTKPPSSAAVVSTIAMTVLWVVSGKLFGVYLRSYSLIGTVYGPYAFLLVLLLWIYYSSIIFVFGGIIGEVYWETVHRRETEASKGGS
jgi:membrane protein